MWISKKKWKDMQNRLSEAEEKIKKLDKEMYPSTEEWRDTITNNQKKLEGQLENWSKSKRASFSE